MKKLIVLATTIALTATAGSAFAQMQPGHGGNSANRGYDMGATSDPHDMKQMMMQMHAMMERGGNMGGGNAGGMMGGGNAGGMMGGGNAGGMMGGGNAGGMMGGGNAGGMMGGGNAGGMMGGGNAGGMGNGQMSGPGRLMGPMMGMLDTDGDGTVTRTEADDQLRAMHETFDADGDGTLTIAEFEALNSSLVRDAMVDRFQYLDADGDGNVSPEEMGAPAQMMRPAPSAESPAEQGQMMNGMNQDADEN